MEEHIENRIDKLESEISKYKKTTIIALVFSIICGGGGLVGLASWISSMPKEHVEKNKIEIETEKLALEIVKDSLDISIKKFNEFKATHNTEIESISRQLELFKSLGNHEQVDGLTNLLIHKEQQFQDLITTTSDMCQFLAQKTGNEQWVGSYLDKMNLLKQESVKNQHVLRTLQ